MKKSKRKKFCQQLEDCSRERKRNPQEFNRRFILSNICVRVLKLEQPSLEQFNKKKFKANSGEMFLYFMILWKQQQKQSMVAYVLLETFMVITGGFTRQVFTGTF